MSQLKRYRRRPDQFVVAIRLDLDLGEEGFVYRKWGGVQRGKRGDWLVDNDGDVYTVDAEVFARTYRRTGPGTYLKTTPVWAEVATTAGRVQTKEGSSAYQAGDYLVSNDEAGTDRYSVSARKFESMYEPD
jgi:hypothetical protein